MVSAAIVIQLRELETACDAAFATMARTTWTATNQVSGQSAYAGDLVSAAEQVIETVKPLVEQKKYLRNLFDKACRCGHLSVIMMQDLIYVPLLVVLF